MENFIIAILSKFGMGVNAVLPTKNGGEYLIGLLNKFVNDKIPFELTSETNEDNKHVYIITELNEHFSLKYTTNEKGRVLNVEVKKC